MPLDKAEEIGIRNLEDANAKSMLFLVSGQQGHKEKPSVFRIRRESAKIVTQKYLHDEYHYDVHGNVNDEKQYWLWELII